MKKEHPMPGVTITTYGRPEPVAQVVVAPARHPRTFEPCLQFTIPVAMLEQLGLRVDKNMKVEMGSSISTFTILEDWCNSSTRRS
jgi:hypothetical protein